MKLMQKLSLIITTVNYVSCTIDGLSYMDPINQRNHDNDKKFPRGEDPCNPLYWYPRNIPESCNIKDEPPAAPKTEAPLPPLPVPIPVPMEPFPFPMPAPMPYPMPIMPPPMPAPMLPPLPMPMGPPPPMPMPIPMPGPFLPIPSAMPMPPLPYGIPIQPSQPMLPMMANYPSLQHPYSMPYFGSGQRWTGLVPPVPGLVAPDGGINIMPFSDAYSDLLEKHKQKMIRKEMQKIVKKYNNKYRWHGRRNLYN